MDKIEAYIAAHRELIVGIFRSLSRKQQLEATKIFTFFKNIFQLDNLVISIADENYFAHEENSSNMEQLIYQFYKVSGKKEKFFLYRVTFTYDQCVDLLRYWVGSDQTLEVIYKSKQANPEIKQQEQIKQEKEELSQKVEGSVQEQKPEQESLDQKGQEEEGSDNQFLVEEQKIPPLIDKYNLEIQKCQVFLQQNPDSPDKEAQLEKLIELKGKLEILKKRMSSVGKLEDSIEKFKEELNQSNDLSYLPKTEPTHKKNKKQVDLRGLFQFYAKQTGVTGALASFDRIQNELQSINYQKLVHFLKRYDLFPKTKEQKKLHNLYVRSCSNGTTLNFKDFERMIKKMPDIVIEGDSQNKSQLMWQKLRNKGNANKELNNAFHSLQRDDFRINKKEIRYQFKIKPIVGKLEREIVSDLEVRKDKKSKEKKEIIQMKMNRKIRRLRKLQAIDPFNSEVVKNSHLLKTKNLIEQQPIASLDNIEKYRDDSFKTQLGLDKEVLFAKREYSVNDASRVKQVQKIELEKISSLMSGIIQRSNQKMEKLGLSPSKRYSNMSNNN